MADHKDGGPGSEMDKRTVFVRNLAFKTTQLKLEEAFTEVGPVRKCFLVKEKGSEQHKGFGFVQFALAEDAERAVESKHGSSLDGRTIKVEVAKKRAPFEDRKTKKREPGEPAPGFKGKVPDSLPGPPPKEETGAAEGVQLEKKETAPEGGAKEVDGNEKVTPKAEIKVAAPEAERGLKQDAKRKREPREGAPAKKPRQEGQVSEKQKPARTVVFGNLATSKVASSVVAKVRSLGQLEELKEKLTEEELTRNRLDKDGCVAPAAMAVFESVRAARAAVRALHGQKMEGHIVWARELGGEGAKLKKWRLIVRNLAFQAKEAALRELFSKAGFVWQLTLPRGKDGRLRGFAFVGYTSKADAEKAIATLNGEKISGRAVVVDWAVAKSEYEAHMAQAKEKDEAGEDGPGEAASADDNGGSSGDESYDREAEGDGASGSEDGEGEESEKDGEGERRGGQVEDEGAMMRKVLNGVMQGDKGADGEAEEAGGVAVMDEEDDPHAARRALSKAAGPRPQDSTASAVKEGPPKKAPEKAERPPPVAVFVRNLPLDVDANEVRRRLAAFGAVMSCRLVKHKLTQRPKGTAFVDFVSKEGAEAAVAASKAAGGLLVDGKAVVADLAVGKEEAKDMAVGLAISVRDKDKRNLYLAEEGNIKEGTPAAAEMSKADTDRRQRLAREKATKLRSPNFFVSPTRLAVHNVPKDVDEKRLKQLVLAAVKERASKQTPQLKQVKILREESKGAKDGPGKSRGAAFVEFSEHQHALVALRALNNNPGPFGAEHRPIVEFAIENRLKLRQREMQQARRAATHPKDKVAEGEDGEGNEMSREERKRKRREEKRKQKKEERQSKRREAESRPLDEAGVQSNGESTASRQGKKRKLEANGRAAGKEGGNVEKVRRRTGDQVKPDKAPHKKEQDLAKELGLPEGEVRKKGEKALSRRERKKGQAKGGEDRLDELVAEYKNKYFQGGGAAGGNAPQQKHDLIAKDLSRWYE